ncbi:nucleotidyltransferase family protein [Pelistega sp. NLN82]|uniref:Nucleotidyltransferase family protein n=1 Tax=Pelistega ratti TaxID=2652177 RepID=A0A6L9Y6R5_9BURK|nr:nucleotidyltransferase family protein [Pelistega ratti]NEN76099.1 nucleotidyltransferase family protein [Pelistega ratti]
MKAMILAAGRGERMRPLTDHLPKPLLSVGGKPLIVWHIERLAKAGFQDIVINHAWLGHKFEEILGNGSHLNVNIHYSPEDTGGFETAGGIATALPLLGSAPFLVINGDVWCDWDPIEALAKAQQLQQQQAKAWLLMVDNPLHHPSGDFHLQNNGKLVQASGSTTLTFAGIGVYDPSLFSALPPRTVAKLAPLLRQAMQEQQVLGTHYKGQWTDVGTPSRLQELDAQLH